MAPTIRADLDGTVLVHHPNGSFTALYAGDAVPEGYTVDSNLLEGDPVDDAGSGSQEPAVDELVAGSIGDVLGRVGDDVEKARAVLAAEQASEKPRAGVVGPLQKLVVDAGSGS